MSFLDHALATREQQEVKYNIYDMTVSAQINSFVVMPTLPFRISRAWNFCSTFNP